MVAVAVICFAAVCIAIFVQQSLRNIAGSLPVTLIEQEREAENMVRMIGKLGWAIEAWRDDASQSREAEVDACLREAQESADTLRSKSGPSGNGAIVSMYAVANPALQEMRRLFIAGVPPGSGSVAVQMLESTRTTEEKLQDLLADSRKAASRMLGAQERRLDAFASAVAVLTGFVVLLVLGLGFLLLRQQRVLALKEQAEMSLLSAMRSAEEANRAKSDFLANMSHELRTPLNAIIGFSSMIEDQMLGPLGNTRYGDYARDIRASGEHLLSIISDILDLSKVEAGRLELQEEEIDAQALMQSALRLVRTKAEGAGLALSLLPMDHSVTLFVDRRALLQVLLNLLSNAVKFTPRGEVTLFGAMLADGSFQICVRDTGIGMTPAQLQRVFEPFYQVQTALTRQQPGTGLGLPLSERLMRLHGGTLRLESSVGVGSRAYITLPPPRVSVSGA